MQLQRQVGLPFRNPSMKKNAANRLPLTTRLEQVELPHEVGQSYEAVLPPQANAKIGTRHERSIKETPGPFQIVGSIAAQNIFLKSVSMHVTVYGAPMRTCLRLPITVWGPESTVIHSGDLSFYPSLMQHPDELLDGSIERIRDDTSEPRGGFCGCYLLKFRSCCGIGSQLRLGNHIQWDLDTISNFNTTNQSLWIHVWIQHKKVTLHTPCYYNSLRQMSADSSSRNNKLSAIVRSHHMGKTNRGSSSARISVSQHPRLSGRIELAPSLLVLATDSFSTLQQQHYRIAGLFSGIKDVWPLERFKHRRLFILDPTLLVFQPSVVNWFIVHPFKNGNHI